MFSKLTSKDDEYKTEPLRDFGCKLWQTFPCYKVYFMEMEADSLGPKGSRLLNVVTFVDTNLCKIQPCQIGFPTVTLRFGMYKTVTQAGLVD